MKKILVPTDFSENANAALQAAILIAEQFSQTEIHLLHVNSAKLINNNDKSTKQNELDKLVETIKRNNLLFIDRLKSRLIDGKTVDVICNYAETENIDLVVMGTKGATGLKEIFWGSNAAGVVEKSKISVLAIPEDYVLRPFKEVVFAVDSSIISTSEIVEPLISLSKIFNSNIKVFHLEKRKEVVGIDPGIDIYLSDVNHSFHQVINTGNISNNINTFTQDENADMLCVIRRPHSFFEEFYHTKTSRQSVLHSPVATLVLIEK